MFQWTVSSQIFCSHWKTWLLPRAETRYSRVWSTISVVTGWVLPKAASLQPGSVSVTMSHKKNETILRTTASSITSAAQFLTFYTKSTLYPYTDLHHVCSMHAERDWKAIILLAKKNWFLIGELPLFQQIVWIIVMRRIIFENNSNPWERVERIFFKPCLITWFFNSYWMPILSFIFFLMPGFINNL